MAIREIRVLGDDVLTKHCKEVTKMSIRTKILIEDMLIPCMRLWESDLQHHRSEC